MRKRAGRTCLGGERGDGKAGRPPECKVPFVATVSLNDGGHPLRTERTGVRGFSLEAVERWATTHLASGSTVSSDGLACFAAQFGRMRASADRRHRTQGRDLREFQWINHTVPGNLRTGVTGNQPAFDFRNHPTR